ncbi:MAG: hypothetical protein ACFFDS_00930 [Candidatus Thorarchaeota archaeon]
MVSEIIKEELRLVNERLRITLVILFFWALVVTLDITGAIVLEAEGVNFLIYAILATTSVVFLVLALGIQIEPFVREMIKKRKEIETFWESKEVLKPSLEKRTKISEIVLLTAIILMMVSLLFVVV